MHPINIRALAGLDTMLIPTPWDHNILEYSFVTTVNCQIHPDARD